MTFSIRLELVALLIIVVLLVLHYDGRNRGNFRYQLFNLCLVSALLSTSLDMLTALAIDGIIRIPFSLNYILNMLYFFILHITFTVMAIYCFYLLFEHIPDRHCYKIATAIIIVTCAVLLTLIATNPWTNWFFYFENDTYMRGPLNKLGYLPMGLELGMVCICYLRNYHLVSRSMHKLIRMLPPIIAVLATVQIIFPDTLMTGTIAAFVNLLFFMSFQSNRIGRDSLTELPNRNTFFQELTLRLQKKKPLHLIMVYLDHYDVINQQYGTPKGDSLLYIVGRYLDRLAPQYQAFRFSNTHFLLLGPWKGKKESTAIAESIQQRFLQPWDAFANDCILNASFAHIHIPASENRSLSSNSNSYSDEENLIIDQLEYTMQTSIKRGTHHLVFFDQQLQKLYLHKNYILHEIKKAIENESFQVYYQPLYHCHTQTFNSAECLLRLKDSNGMYISPAEFIPLAEQNGLIDEITWLLMKKVAQFLSSHPELPLKTVSINLTAQLLSSRAFWQHFYYCQEQYHVTPEQLRIEITERTFSENPTVTRNTMTQLVEEGIQFYLDDFGIGYSNLASVLLFPFDSIKLDISLLQNIVNSDKSAHTIALLIEMLHNNGFHVVAEGLETAEIVEKAIQLGVDSIQGYYYARPMPEEELLNFLLHSNRE